MQTQELPEELRMHKVITIPYSHIYRLTLIIKL